MSRGAERLVLSGERFGGFQAGHSRNVRSDYLELLNRSRAAGLVKLQSSQHRRRDSSVTPRAYLRAKAASQFV